MGGLHAVSGVLMVALGNDFALDVSTLNLNGPPGTPLSEGTLDAAFSIPLAVQLMRIPPPSPASIDG